VPFAFKQDGRNHKIATVSSILTISGVASTAPAPSFSIGEGKPHSGIQASECLAMCRISFEHLHFHFGPCSLHLNTVGICARAYTNATDALIS
jgi:hypothetical protein